MKTKEFELLIKTGGIESVEIEDHESIFSLHIMTRGNDKFKLNYDDPYFYIESARNTRRQWKDLARLYKFIRDSGWKETVTIVNGPKRMWKNKLNSTRAGAQ